MYFIYSYYLFVVFLLLLFFFLTNIFTRTIDSAIKTRSYNTDV